MVELLFVGDVLRDILQATVQNCTQLVQRMCRYRHIRLKSLDSRGHRPKKFPWGYDETDARCVALKKELVAHIDKLKECILKRNRYLVDHAACLLAVYNGAWRGGTAMTVRYARKLKREIIVIEPYKVAITL